MKKKILLTLASLIVVFVISLPITRYKFEEKINPPSVPQITELENYLLQSESKFTDIVSGAEKKIFWANGKQEQSEYSIVYIHGYSSSRPEMLPLPDMIASDLKANIYYTRLTGHARSSEAFSQATVNDWLNDTVEALEIGKRIGKKVIVIGSSTGCTLATWLASKPEYQKEITTLIFISPNFYPHTKMTKLFLYPAGIEFAKLVYGKEREWKPHNEMVAKYWTHRYKWEALTPMMLLVEFVHDIPLESIKMPTLFLYTDKDTVIDPNEIVDKFSHLGSKNKRLRNLSQVPDHVMAGDIRSPETTPLLHSEIIGFLNEIGIK